MIIHLFSKCYNGSKNALTLKNKHLTFKSIPCKQGSRSYTIKEHIEVITTHIQAHLKDVNNKKTLPCKK